MCVCVCVRVYVYTYVYVCVCSHTHTHTHTHMAGNGLLARLELKRCISDDAVPASLRCATIVVGKRLFLFPKGRDGMCDLQFAMVVSVSSSYMN